MGSGFSGLSLVNSLDSQIFDVTVVSPRSSFVYTPLLSSVLVGEVDIQSVVEPLEWFRSRTNSSFVYTPLLSSVLVGEVDIQSVVEPLEWFRSRTNSSFNFLEAYAEDVNLDNKKVFCKPVHFGSKFELDYDFLVVAVGGYQNTHNIPGVDKNCYFFNSLNDCRRLRNRVVGAIELCNLPEISEEEKRRNLHFVIVGGGPTARITAEYLKKFVDEQTSTYCPQLKEYAKVTLVDMNDHIHNAFDHAISNYYKKSTRGHYDVIHDKIVSVNPFDITLEGKDGKTMNMDYGTCIWSTGTVAHPLAKQIAAKLPLEQNNKQALVVDKGLRVKGTKDVFALGDCATIHQKDFLHWVKKEWQDDDQEIDFETWKAKSSEVTKKYPAIKEFQSRAEKLFTDFSRDGKVSIKDLKQIVLLLDQQLTSFPSTASTAIQQGQFLAAHLREAVLNLEEFEKSKFRYKHIGGFEYINVGEELVERGSRGKFIFDGPGAWWMWSNVNYSYFMSIKMRIAVATSWLITTFFGRKLTRY
uniref:NADH:ubiquinone reductase (non-electrogenic) n=1 Tax=Arcella intermedia TaxID=1963864 RepID=A0A6B2L1H2_9EUKA